MRKLLPCCALLLAAMPACVELPPEPDGPFLECSNQDGLWGGIDVNGDPLCMGVTVEVTTMDTIYVNVSLRDGPEGEMRGSLTLNFELPAENVPSEAAIDAFTLGRYDSPDGTGTVESATIVVHEDEIGALGTLEISATGPDGNTVEFENGVYYSLPIRRR